jgi:hypothetical protein
VAVPEPPAARPTTPQPSPATAAMSRAVSQDKELIEQAHESAAEVSAAVQGLKHDRPSPHPVATRQPPTPVAEEKEELLRRPLDPVTREEVKAQIRAMLSAGDARAQPAPSSILPPPEQPSTARPSIPRVDPPAVTIRQQLEPQRPPQPDPRARYAEQLRRMGITGEVMVARFSERMERDPDFRRKVQGTDRRTTAEAERTEDVHAQHAHGREMAAHPLHEQPRAPDRPSARPSFLYDEEPRVPARPSSSSSRLGLGGLGRGADEERSRGLGREDVQAPPTHGRDRASTLFPEERGPSSAWRLDLRGLGGADQERARAPRTDEVYGRHAQGHGRGQSGRTAAQRPGVGQGERGGRAYTPFLDEEPPARNYPSTTRLDLELDLGRLGRPDRGGAGASRAGAHRTLGRTSRAQRTPSGSGHTPPSSRVDLGGRAGLEHAQASTRAEGLDSQYPFGSTINRSQGQRVGRTAAPPSTTPRASAGPSSGSSGRRTRPGNARP